MAKELKLMVERKDFVNNQNEKISFVECSVVINGEKFVLKPKTEDKKMFNYMLKQVGV